MAKYTFRFFFAEMDEARRFCEVKTWGGNLGKAFSRAWYAVKARPEYRIKNLQPTTIDLEPPDQKKKNITDYRTTIKVGV